MFSFIIEVYSDVKNGYRNVGEKMKVPTYCMQCVCGPCPLKVIVEDGEAVGIEPNFDAEDVTPGEGRVCAKAYSQIDKLYNKNRLQKPLKRTNPKKGWGEDPQWEEISWDEAISILADKFSEIKEKKPFDEGGYPRIAVTMGGGGITEGHFGTFPAFLPALKMPIDMSLGSGQGVACYHSEHVYNELWHRAFLAVPDVTNSEYIVSFGANIANTKGPNGIRKYADAIEDGLKLVQVEPHITSTGGIADEWIPIKPKTDAAFLYGLLNVMLHEMDWEEISDIDFLKEMTNSPYLVTPDGYFIRDPDSEKPLVWDPEDEKAKEFDDNSISDFALEGSYKVDGVEIRKDDERNELEDVTVKPAFQLLREHMEEYTPEWASEICDVKASTIRRIAKEVTEHAHVGSTIKIEGMELPYRPIAMPTGKTVNNGWGGYSVAWARTVLAMMFGAIEVPGGLISIGSRLNRPYYDKWKTVKPGADGFMNQDLSPTKKGEWPGKLTSRGGLTTLTPLVGTDGWAQGLSPSTVAWNFMRETPENWPEQSYPDIWLIYRANPVLSFADQELVVSSVKEFPFTVTISYTIDETNWFADLVLPENIGLESLQLKQLGGLTHTEDSFFERYGFVLKQPVVEPQNDTIEMTELWTRLAEEVGVLERYNSNINKGYGGTPLKGENYDYTLKEDERHSPEEIWDRVCRCATLNLTGNKEEKDLEWFKENGFYTVPFPKYKHYLHPVMKENNLRYELPYQERIMKMGEELEARLHEKGVDWWDKQLEEYEAFPEGEDFSKRWGDHYGEEYEQWALTAKSIHYAYGANVTVPISSEVSKVSEEFEGVCISPKLAEEKGIERGDEIKVKSPFGEVKGDVIIREGIRPDVVLMVGQFGQKVTPYAKNLKTPNITELMSQRSLDLIDGTGSLAHIAKVNVEKA